MSSIKELLDQQQASSQCHPIGSIADGGASLKQLQATLNAANTHELNAHVDTLLLSSVLGR